MATHLDTVVSSVAVLIDDAEQFRRRAAEVARELGPYVIEELATRFHSPPKPMPVAFQKQRLGAWLSAWQFAIFELYFHFGPAALPVLRRVAFGEYDWTQGNAIEVLVRLAATGIERERTLAELRREFSNLRYEAILYAIGPLLHHAARDSAVAAIIRELRDLPEWQVAADELQAADRVPSCRD